MEEDDMVKSRYGNTSYRDKPMRRERAAGARSLTWDTPGSETLLA